MHFLRNRLNLSHRLIGGFGLVLGLLLVITFMSLQSMQRMEANLRNIVEVQDKRIGQAQAMMNAINEMSVAIFSSAGSEDEEDVKFHIHEIDSAFKHYDAARSAFNALLSSAEPDAAAPNQLRKVDRADANARAMVDSLRKLAASNPQGMTDVLVSINPRSAQDAWLQEVVAQVALESATTETSYALAQASYSRARMLLIGATLAALCVGVIAGAMILRSVTQPLKEAIRHASRIASGDLSGNIETTRSDETGALLLALGKMQQQLRNIVGAIRTVTESITYASSEIAQGNMNLSARTEQTASGLQQASASMDQLSSKVHRSRMSAESVRELAMAASTVAQKGGSVVSEVVNTMGHINDSSKKIVDIIGVIDGIAFQTNILALNAAIEAARAGEQGRGFAVVAGEVRMLAKRSSEAAREIKVLIVTSVEKIDYGARLAQSAGNTMGEIMDSVRRVNNVVSEITGATLEQSQDIEEVTSTVANLDRVTQQNASLVEEGAASTASLRDDVQLLSKAVSAFRFEAGL